MESDKKNTTHSNGSPQNIQPSDGRTAGPKRRSRQWNAKEDEILRQAVQQFKGKSWKKIAELFKNRTGTQCLHRWQKVLDPELVKGPWSEEEDEILIRLVNQYGPKKWSTIAQELAGRIGKQCRERWHNHLNPAINKEAWTQEEELHLIRAHQIYGNRWAELSRFLPGRTDNGIKNHWHSSVKKKLDSYLASGLLAQLPSLPNVNYQNQSIPSSSSMNLPHNSEDESVNDGIAAQEVSECSQGSTLAGCCQSTSRANGRMLEESLYKKDTSSSAPACFGNYAPNFQDVSCSMPEVPSELAGSKFFEHNFSHDLGTMGKDWQFNKDEIPNISSLDMQDFSGLLMHCLNGNENHAVVPFPLQTEMGFGIAANVGNVEDGRRIVYPEAGIPQCSPSETGINGCGEPAESLIFQLLNCPFPETGDMTPQNCNESSLDDFEASFHQPISVPSQFLAEDRSLVFGIASNQFNSSPIENPVQESFTRRCDDFVNPSESGTPSNNCIENPAPTGRLNQTKDSSRLVCVNDLGYTTSNSIQKVLLYESSFLPEKKNTGALCYDPPRFPSMDVPFLSCDLIQSGSDTLQEYSPFGIRQLMISAHCLTPLRLWDSPSRENSPDAILKSAAKTFTGTPSILKKRHRHLVSPLSEKRCEKRLESDFNQESFSKMTAVFSRLDDVFDESANEKASGEDKENLHPSSEGGRQEESDGIIGPSSGDSGRQLDGGGAHCCKEPHAKSAGANDQMGNVKQSPGVLVELTSNSMFFSPDRLLIKCDGATSPSNKALGDQHARRLEAASNQVTVSSSFETSCLSVLCSPPLRGKCRGSVVIAKSLLPAHSSALVNTAENSENAETLSIFGETPLKRNIEFPSAWKSPWFMNSFQPSPRCDTELAFEDLANFMSPGDGGGSYDAIGLMKQLSEQTAASIAEAHQILGNETPEKFLLERNSKTQKPDDTNSLLASHAMSEKRAIDFSECGASTKGKGTTKSDSSSNSFSSPASYLLKCCR